MKARLRRARPAILAVALVVALIALANPLAGAADMFGNVGPAPEISGGALSEQYPQGNYTLDQHFKAVEVSLTGGVDVSGVPPMIAYFLASVIWELTAFLARALIMSFAVEVSKEDIEQQSSRGRNSSFLYRRVRIGVPFDAWSVVRYRREIERENQDVESYIAAYLTHLINRLDTTDYLREWMRRQSPIEIPANFRPGTWV